MKNTGRILSFLIAALMVISLFSFTGCSGETPMSVYKDGVNALASADGISYVFDFTFDDVGYKMNVKKSSNGVKQVVFSADESKITIYVDGSNHYYDFGEIKYKVASDADSVIMQELLDFEFFHGDASLFTKEIFKNAEFVADGDGRYVELKLSGEALKNALAPDEDVTFGETSFKIVFDNENSISKIEFSTIADGKEFYGIPVGKDKKMTASYTVNETGKVSVETPSDKDKFDDMPAMAVLTPAALAYRNAMGMDMIASIDIEMMGMSFSVPMEVSMRTQLVDGKQLTRTITKINASIMGQTINETSDVFTDGNGNFEYYTDADGNYKVEIEAADGEDSEDMLEDLKDPELFKNAEVKKSGGNTVITVELTNELLNSLMSGDMMGSMGDMTDSIGNQAFEFKDSKMTVIVSSDGYILSAEIKMSGSQKISEESLGVEYEMTMDIKMDITLVEPNEEITVEIPEGYIDYPLQEDVSEI